MKVFTSTSFIPFDFKNSMKSMEKKNLIEEEISWLTRFLICVQEHLSDRKSDGIPLMQNDSIKTLMADVVLNIEILNVQMMHFEKASMSLLSKIVRETCHDLAKLAGGRGFLCGNIIEMLWTFDILNQLYLRS